MQPILATPQPVLPPQGPKRGGKGWLLERGRREWEDNAPGEKQCLQYKATASPRRCHGGRQEKACLDCTTFLPSGLLSRVPIDQIQEAREQEHFSASRSQEKGQRLDLRSKQNNSTTPKWKDLTTSEPA